MKTTISTQVIFSIIIFPFGLVSSQTQNPEQRSIIEKD